MLYTLKMFKYGEKLENQWHSHYATLEGLCHAVHKIHQNEPNEDQWIGYGLEEHCCCKEEIVLEFWKNNQVMLPVSASGNWKEFDDCYNRLYHKPKLVNDIKEKSYYTKEFLERQKYE